jgi:hypothetical protein
VNRPRFTLRVRECPEIRLQITHDLSNVSGMIVGERSVGTAIETFDSAFFHQTRSNGEREEEYSSFSHCA